MTDGTKRRPIGTGGLRRKMTTGDLGVPVWLHDLLSAAGWGPFDILAIEVGGRGVLHPEAGWVSVDELRELAGGRESQEP